MNKTHQEELTTGFQALVWTALLISLVLAFVIYRLQPPMPKNSMGNFSAAQALSVLQRFSIEDIPHPVDSDRSENIRERIVSHLESLDYDVHIQESFTCRHGRGSFVKCANVRNILTQLPGQQAGKAVVLVAHYDSVNSGPGIADNSVNVASILEIARILKSDGPFRNPIIFLLSDGEEAGLLGAQAFIDEHPWAKNIGVVVNLEARGTSGQSIMFETSDDNSWLIKAYSATANLPATNSLFFEVYRTLPNDTDFTVFKENGIPGVNFAFIDGLSYYHTPLDNMKNLDWGSVQHQGDNALEITRYFAEIDLTSHPLGNDTYIDILGFFVLRWPKVYTIGFVFLTIGAFLIVSIRLIHQQYLRVNHILWGMLVPIISLLLSVVLSMGLISLISTLARSSTPWYAYPLPTQLVLWLTGILSGVLASNIMASKATFWGTGIGVWFFWSLLGLLFTLTLTGIAVVFLIPSLFASIMLIGVTFTKKILYGLVRDGAFISTIFVTAIIWFPVTIMLELGVGLKYGPIIAASVALVATTVAPFFVLIARQWYVNRRILIVTSLLIIIASIVAVYLPSYSSDSPQQLNIIYFVDHDNKMSYWVADNSTYIPNALYDKGEFQLKPREIFPWSKRKFFVAQTSYTTVEALNFDLIAEYRDDEEWVLEVQLKCPREADRFALFIPIEHLNSVVIARRAFTVDRKLSSTNYYTVYCEGRSCDALPVIMRFTRDDPIPLLLAAWKFSLPTFGNPLQEARSTSAIPFQDGDATIVLHREIIVINHRDQ